ncbi:MAG: TMEM14 family protein [Candidatus Obscuribacterales bacterium]|nr:TMEM14 family protein [Candidatus Obscuribacterales bacterium]
MSDLGRLSLLILSIFVLVGGIIGYTKAKSKASLIAGTISSVLLAVSFAYALQDPLHGLMAGLGVTVLLDVIFVIRLVKTKKFMPSGMMIILCLITQGIVVKELLSSPLKIY